MRNTAQKEPDIRPSGKKRRSLLGQWVASETRPAGRYAYPYLGLPASMSGIPNYMQYRVGPGADLCGADLSSADLRWHNFRGARLRDAQLADSVLWGCNFAQADLSGADIRYADLTGADLVGTNLTGASVEGACFVGARYSAQSTVFPKGFGNPADHGMISLDESQQTNLY